MGKSTTSLHLYLPEQGISQLKKGQLLLQRSFPWLQPYAQAVPRLSKKLPVSESELAKQWQIEYAKLPAAIKALLSFADFKAQSPRLLPAIEQAILEQRPEQPITAKVYPVQLFESLSALRLFSSAVSHFGWSALAGQFAGLSLALSPSAKAFAATEQRLTLLRPVQYGSAHNVQRNAENPLPGFFNDVDENAALQEWRFAAYEKGQSPAQTIKITRDLITSIYLGPLASEVLVEQVLNLVRQDIRYRSVSVLQVQVDNNTWRLTAEKIAD